MLSAEKCYENYDIISDDFYFIAGVANILSSMKIDTGRKVKIIDVRTNWFPSLGDEDVAVLILSPREKEYLGFFSKMLPYHGVVVSSQLEITIKKLERLFDLFSAPGFMGGALNVGEFLNDNEIDFLRLTLKGFTVLQYSKLRERAPKTVYQYKRSIASKLRINIKLFDYLLVKYFLKKYFIKLGGFL